MRALVTTMISLTLTAAVIGNAFYQKKQFYPSVVYITKSNLSMAVIYVQAFIMVLLMGKLMRKVFFGQLRAAEFEHLVERSWYAITETCLAFTMFRDDFSPKFVAFFTILLFLKSFHWLAEDRVDYMERSPVIGFLFHIRVQSLLAMLTALDLLFIMHAYQSNVTKGASVQLVFGFEYAILIIMIVNISIKYFLHAIDSHWETPWENKAVVLLYTELVVGFLKVVLYISFMAIMMQKYTLPLFAFRPMYYTMRNFKKAFNDVILSRRAIRNMNTLYPDATRAELAAVDNVCIICREEMNSGAKKLPCNHIFHASCLRSWFQRQQTCPTCRLNILQGAGPAQPAAQVPPPQQQQQNQPPAHQPAQGQQQAGQPNAAPPFAGMPNMMPPFGSMPNVMPPFGNMPNMVPPFPGVPNMTAAFTASMPNVTMTPFMAFPWPPPPIPPNLATLTPAELARMEGRGRQHVEARIQCLQNIQTMLDASVMMMQQYSAIANRYPASLEPREVGTQTTEEAASEAADAVKAAKTEETSVQNKDADPKVSVMDTPGTSGLSTVKEASVSSSVEDSPLMTKEVPKDSSADLISSESSSGQTETMKPSPPSNTSSDAVLLIEPTKDFLVKESSPVKEVDSKVELKKADEDNASVADSSSVNNESEQGFNEGSSSKSDGNPFGDGTATDELRRRRLEKFKTITEDRR